MAGDLAYFWIPSPDPERGHAFYSALFGWTLEPRAQGDGYGIASTSVYGGLVSGRDSTRPFLYFAVDDIVDAVDEVRELGGRAGDPTAFGEGASSHCTYDGVEFGLFRPAGGPQPPIVSDQPGDLGYFVVPVRDAAEGRSFYAAVLGWEYAHDDIDAAYHHVVNVLPPGGLFTGDRGSRPKSYLRVDDIQFSIARLRELGGEAGAPVESANGASVDCRDDQGVEISLWQPAAGL